MPFGPLATGSVASGAPDDAQYVVMVANATLTQERVLTGTANQVTIADGGAGAAVTLALPQDYDAAATPTLGGLTLNGALLVHSQNEVRWYDNGNYVGFEAGALGADQIWVLPTADGGVNEFLQTDGGGNLTWAAAGGGGAPGGANKQVQYNNAAAFGGAAGFEWQNASPNVLIVAQNAAHVPFVIRTAAAQTASGFEYQDSAGGFLANFDAEGYLGIGETNVYSGLTVSESGAQIHLHARSYGADASNDRGVLVLERARGTRGAPAIVQDGDRAGEFQANAYNGVGYSSIAGIRFEIDGAPAGGGARPPGRITFSTAVGSGTVTDRLVINSSGNVLVDGFSSTTVGLTVRAGAGNTAGIQEWKDSGGNTRLIVQPAGHLQFGNGINIVVGTSTGTEIGTAANQKIGFFGQTPRVQADKASFNNWAAFTDVVDALVDLGLFDAA